MARDFSKNVSNYLSLGTGAISPLLDGAAAVSVGLWLTYDTISAFGGENFLFRAQIETSTPGLTLNLDGSAGGRLRVTARSVQTDSTAIVTGSTGISAGVPAHVGAVLDYAGDAITVYLNGAADGTTGVTFGNAAYTAGGGGYSTPDVLGGSAIPPGSTGSQFDGRISELALWTTDIGAAGFAMLGNRFAPAAVRPDSLAFYMPLVGGYSPEIDLVAGTLGTITGTVAAAAHPAIRRVRRRGAISPLAAVGAAPTAGLLAPLLPLALAVAAAAGQAGYSSLLWFWGGGAGGEGGAAGGPLGALGYHPTHRRRRR